ncbi:MAG TPA: hypothetical protein VIV11_08035, partial [Kofleriaceae bacterium]
WNLDEHDDAALLKLSGATEAELHNKVSGTCQNAAVVNAVMAKLAGFTDVEIITLRPRVKESDLIAAGFLPSQLAPLMDGWNKWGGIYTSGHAIIRVKASDGRFRYISYGEVELIEVKVLPSTYRGQFAGKDVPVDMPNKPPQDVSAFVTTLRNDNIAYFAKPLDDQAPTVFTRKVEPKSSSTVSRGRTATVSSEDNREETVEQRKVASVGWVEMH